MGEGNVFTRVCPPIRLSVHTPTWTEHMAVGMPLAFTHYYLLFYYSQKHFCKLKGGGLIVK